MKKYAVPFLAVLVVGGCVSTGSGVHGVFRQVMGDEIAVRATAGAGSIESLIPRNGAAFAEFGADSCLIGDLREDGRNYTVTVTTFVSAKGARGAYDFSRPAAGFVKGCSLVSVEPEDGADTTRAAEVARTLARRIPGPMFATELYAPLPEGNRLIGSEFAFMGPVAFAARFSPELARELSAADAIEGMGAKYRLAEGGEVTLVKIRFAGRARTMEALRVFIAGREGTPMVRPTGNRDYYTLFDSGSIEIYIAEYGDWLLWIPDAPRGGDARQFFEYALRCM